MPLTFNNKEATFIGIVLIIVIVIIGPFITIWAMNTLFPTLAIPYNFWTWLSSVILGGIFYSRR